MERSFIRLNVVSFIHATALQIHAITYLSEENATLT